MRFILRLSLGLLLAAGTRTPLQTQVPAGSLTLVGEGGASKTLSMAELAALPQHEVIVRERDSSATVFRGPTPSIPPPKTPSRHRFGVPWEV